MSPILDEPGGRGTGWRSLIVVGAVYFAGMAGYTAWRADRSTDFRDFWENAAHFRQTGEISMTLGVHNYLPFFTMFMMPWSFLPLPLAIAIFTVLSGGFLAITVVVIEWLWRGFIPARPSAALILALVLALPYIHSGVTLGTVGLLLLFLIVATWFLVQRGHEWIAGLTLGLATLIKLLPLVLMLFFLIRGRWRVTLSAAATALALGVGSSLATLGVEQSVAQHREFFERAIVGHSAWTTIMSDKPIKAKYNNNALPIVLRRLLSKVNSSPDDRGSQLFVNIANLPGGAIFGSYVAIIAPVAATSVLVLWPRIRKGRRASGADSRVGVDDPHRAHVLFAVWCCLMLLVSPLLWTHYLALAFFPLYVLVWEPGSAPARGLRLPRVPLLALSGWLGGALLLIWPAARAVGAQWLAVAGLWAALVWLATRRGLRDTIPHRAQHES
jgi:hypothetical protein